MSDLRVLWPDEESQGNVATLEEPAILPFRSERSQQGWRFDIVARARAIYDNRTCPHCEYAVVVPIELDDATLNRTGQPIPGTATLVGFRCRGCRTEWSV